MSDNSQTNTEEQKMVNEVPVTTNPINVYMKPRAAEISAIKCQLEYEQQKNELESDEEDDDSEEEEEDDSDSEENGSESEMYEDSESVTEEEEEEEEEDDDDDLLSTVSNVEEDVTNSSIPQHNKRSHDISDDENAQEPKRVKH